MSDEKSIKGEREKKNVESMRQRRRRRRRISHPRNGKTKDSTRSISDPHGRRVMERPSGSGLGMGSVNRLRQRQIEPVKNEFSS